MSVQPAVIPLPPRDLFVYVDESGNFDFSPKGSSWFYLTALSTMEPSFALGGWHDVKHGAIKAGVLLEELKASEDKQWIRDQVFALLGTGLGQVRVDGVAVDKAKTHPTLRRPDKFYGEFAMHLLWYVLQGRRKSFDRVFVLLDTIPVEKKRRAIVGALKTSLAAAIPGVPYEILERDSRGEHLLQLVDYCGWALYVARERAEGRPRAAITSLVRSDFDIFRRGKVRYY